MVPVNNPWSSRLSFLAYAIGTFFLAGYAVWLYLMGEYAEILLPATLTLLMSCAIFLRVINRTYRRPAAYLALITCYLLVATKLPSQHHLATLWLGLPPVLTGLLLPLGPALLLNLALTPVWLIALESDLPMQYASAHYLALVGIITLFCRARQEQKRRLCISDPLDAQCRALSQQALAEQLSMEMERTKALDQPLAVLLIQLPQLEMVDEQFGGAIHQALLERLCDAVQVSCRQQDRLGRQQRSLFWLLLPNTGEAGALIVRERLIQALSREVLAETGPIHANIRVCHVQRGESELHFEQRLLAAGLKLLEPVS